MPWLIKQNVLFKETYVSVPEKEEQYLESVISKNWKIPDSYSDVYKLKIELEELDILGKGISIWLMKGMEMTWRH